MSTNNISSQGMALTSLQTTYQPPPPSTNQGEKAVPQQTPSTSGTVPASQSNASTAASAAQATKEQVKEAVKKANETIDLLRNNLQFSIDEETGTNVVKVIDNETKEVIRQIPSEEMLSITHRLDELTGLLIRDKA